LGSSDRDVHQDAFTSCPSLTMICVPETYDSDSFCMRSITCKSSSCSIISSHCFGIEKNEDMCIVEKKSNVIAWENHTNNCVEYSCDNESGLLSRSICYKKDEHILCFKDECIDEDNAPDKEWKVYIGIVSPSVIAMSANEIGAEISHLSGLEEKDFEVGMEHDEEGRIIRVIILVNNESDAKKIKKAIDSMDKGKSCQGLFCFTKTITIKGVDGSVSVGSASSFEKESFNCLMIIMATIVASMICTI